MKTRIILEEVIEPGDSVPADCVCPKVALELDGDGWTLEGILDNLVKPALMAFGYGYLWDESIVRYKDGDVVD